MRVALLLVIPIVSCGGRTTEPELVDGGTDAVVVVDSSAVDTSKPDTPFVCVDSMGNMPIALKTCMNNSDCMMLERQSDCCGSMTLVGIRADAFKAFQTCEAERQKGLPMCDCLALPTRAEDGRETSGRFPIVVCADRTSSGGICRTYVELIEDGGP